MALDEFRERLLISRSTALDEHVVGHVRGCDADDVERLVDVFFPRV